MKPKQGCFLFALSKQECQNSRIKVLRRIENTFPRVKCLAFCKENATVNKQAANKQTSNARAHLWSWVDVEEHCSASLGSKQLLHCILWIPFDQETKMSFFCARKKETRETLHHSGAVNPRTHSVSLSLSLELPKCKGFFFFLPPSFSSRSRDLLFLQVSRNDADVQRTWEASS